MVRRDDCLVQLNDAEEAEQRALEGRPDCATRCWSSVAPAAPTPNFEGEDVPAREHGAVEVSTTVEAMQSVELGCAVDSFARRKTAEKRRSHTQTRTTKQQKRRATVYTLSEFDTL